VYVLRSLADGRLYTGQTRDVEARLQRHNAGLVAATKGRRPFVLLYKEGCSTRSEARRREEYFKTGKGRDELTELLEGRLQELGM
jgi:putative endonuclease